MAGGDRTVAGTAAGSSEGGPNRSSAFPSAALVYQSPDHASQMSLMPARPVIEVATVSRCLETGRRTHNANRSSAAIRVSGREARAGDRPPRSMAADHRTANVHPRGRTRVSPN
jgi:hypothetical protein